MPRGVCNNCECVYECDVYSFLVQLLRLSSSAEVFVLFPLLFVFIYLYMHMCVFVCNHSVCAFCFNCIFIITSLFVSVISASVFVCFFVCVCIYAVLHVRTCSLPSLPLWPLSPDVSAWEQRRTMVTERQRASA